MSFRIPSLEEARKKQEKLLSQDQAPSLKPRNSSSIPNAKSVSNHSISTTQSNATSKANTNSSLTTQGTKPKIVNPYLKYKKKKQAATSTAIIKTTKTTTNASIQREIQTKPKKKFPTNPNASTFSQAFHSVEQSNSNTAENDTNTEHERALGASNILSQLEQTNSIYGENAPAKRNNIARDNHALLQPHILHGKTSS